MLLRSSSNPVLESLLPLPLHVTCHTDPSADLSFKHHENQLQPGEAAGPKSLFFTNSCRPATPSSSSLTHPDPQLQLSSPLGGASFGSMRKVLSENDLFVLADGSFSSVAPAQFAANSLLQDDAAAGCALSSSDPDLAIYRSPHPHGKKSAISRWRSLGSLPFELLSVLYDSESAISEEGDLVSSISSSASINEEEETKRRICTFDKLALPISDTSNVKAEQAGDSMEHVCFKLPQSTLSQTASDKTHAYGSVEQLDAERTGFEMNLSLHGVDTGSSDSQKSSYIGGQGASCLLEAGINMSMSQPKYVYKTALGAGAGGRGTRPPSGAGRGGSGGDAGGRGGRNSDSTELHYQSMLKESPCHPLILQNYAQYLAEVKHDYQRAEEFFERAILVNPSDGELLSQYARLLWEVQQDRKRAATYFERAVQAAPDNSYVMAAYASFLWSAEEEEQEDIEEVMGSSPGNVPASIFSLVPTGAS